MKINKTFKVIGSMTIITIFAKLAGLIRVSLFASLFGTSAEAGIFLGASRLPILFFDLTLGAAILSTFIPVFNKKLTNEGRNEATLFANNFITITTVFTFIICLLGVIFSEQIVGVMLPGFDAYQAYQAAQILRILFPVIIFTALAFTSVGILQSFDEFNVPAAISLVSNGIMILYFIIFGRNFGVFGIAVAMLIGWSMQFLIQVPSLIKKKFRYRFVLNLKDPAMGEVVRLAIPVLISSWVHPIGIAINVMFASRLGAAYVAGLELANTIYIIGVGVFTLAVTNFIFPKLSRLHAEGNVEGFSQTVKTSISYLTYAVIPVMALFIALAAPIIQLLYGRGEFGPESVRLVSSALTFYALGMVSFSITEILNRTFFATQDGKTPMIASIIGITCNVALSAYLIFVQGFGVWALALSAAFGMTVTAVILMSVIARRRKGVLNRTFVANLLKTIFCGIGAAVTAAHIYSFAAANIGGAGIFAQIAKLFLASAGAGVVYLLLCWIFQVKEQQGLVAKVLGKR